MIMELSERGKRAVADFRAARDEIAKLEEVKEVAKAVVLDELGEDEEGTIDGEVVVTNRFSAPLILDQRKLNAHFDKELLAPYLRPSPRHTFKVLD